MLTHTRPRSVNHCPVPRHSTTSTSPSQAGDPSSNTLSDLTADPSHGRSRSTRRLPTGRKRTRTQ